MCTTQPVVGRDRRGDARPTVETTRRGREVGPRVGDERGGVGRSSPRRLRRRGPGNRGQNTRETPDTLAVAGTDRLRFDPDELTIPAGEQIALELRAGSVEHDFVIADAAKRGDTDTDHQADDPDDLHVAHANAGESVTGTFTIDDPGTYTVYCSVAGHRDAGMIASLEVTDAVQRSTP